LHPILLRRRCGVEESSGMEANGEAGEGAIGQVNCFAAATFQEFSFDEQNPIISKLRRRFAARQSTPTSDRLKTGERGCPSWDDNDTFDGLVAPKWEKNILMKELIVIWCKLCNLLG
jgi:hypothetical protein